MRPTVSLSITAILLLVCAAAWSKATSAGSPQAEAMTADVPVFPRANRPDVMGREFALSSDHPLATAAGFDVLRRGGNAVDAAVTMAGVLAVVRPHMNGVGGDVLALIYDARSRRLEALNGSGRAGALATPAFFRRLGHEQVPARGPLSVTVPGAVAAWEDALRRHGTISLDAALGPAIRYAEEGFPVSQRLHDDIASEAGALDRHGRALYLPGGSPPVVGSLLRNPALAKTLRTIAERGPEAIYGGPIGQQLASFLENEGGYLRPADFAAHKTTWEEPIGIDYLGLRVFAVPPSTQGITLLQQMRLAAALGDLGSFDHNGSAYLNRMIEFKRLAFADRDRWVADPAFTEVAVGRMLDPDYASSRAATIRPGAPARHIGPGFTTPAAASTGSATAAGGDTVYLTVVDREGNAVSWIQSLYAGFGSGLVEPETGIVLHNRGAHYTLAESHPQVIAPGKRPFHTLTPHLAFEGDRLALTVGTPGGHGQTQTLIQVFHNLFLFGMHPQAAIEAARYRSEDGLAVLVEDRIPLAARTELTAMGYELQVIHGWDAAFGGAQLVLIHPESNVRIAAADPRREAYALAH